MYASPVSDSEPKSGKLLLAGFLIAIAIIILIAGAPRIMDYFSGPEEDTGDSDHDGVPNEEDVFPHDPSEWADNDGDGIGDNADIDDDNDDYRDENDYFPFYDAAITIKLIHLRLLGAVDTPPFDNTPGEIYLVIYLDGEELVTASPPNEEYWNDVGIDVIYGLNWSYTLNVPDDRSTFEISIELYDRDPISPEQIDIDGTFDGDYTLDIRYRLQSGRWSGDDSTGTTDGTRDEGGVFEKDALLKYSVKTVPA